MFNVEDWVCLRISIHVFQYYLYLDCLFCLCYLCLHNLSIFGHVKLIYDHLIRIYYQVMYLFCCLRGPFIFIGRGKILSEILRKGN